MVNSHWYLLVLLAEFFGRSGWTWSLRMDCVTVSAQLYYFRLLNKRVKKKNLSVGGKRHLENLIVHAKCIYANLRRKLNGQVGSGSTKSKRSERINWDEVR